MYSLVIDTSTKIQYIGLYDQNTKLIKQKKQISENSHLEIIHENIQEVCSVVKNYKQKITKIIVVNGPGSFTGVRIGIIVAKVIACELKAKLYTCSTLKLLATSNLDKNSISIEMSKIKTFVINYDIIENKLVNIKEAAVIKNGAEISPVNLVYENLFIHSYLLEEVSFLDAKPNYIETPNFVKKLNK